MGGIVTNINEYLRNRPHRTRTPKASKGKVTDINTYLRNNISEVSVKRVSIAPNIPEGKLNNAVKAFGFSGSIDTIVAIYDNTLLGSGKDGILFTGERFIYRPAFGSPIGVPFADVDSVKHSRTATGKKNDKIVEAVEIALNGGGTVALKDFIDCDYERLTAILQSCIDDFDEYKEAKQLIPVEEMSDAVKIAYVKAVINMAYWNDGAIDEKEFAEILLLMTRLNLSPDARFTLRAYLSSADGLTPFESILADLHAGCPDGQIKTLHVSLTKDLINTHMSTGGKSVADFGFFQEHRRLLDIADGEIELIMMAIENDFKMLKSEFTDDHLVAAMKLLSAKAAAVGTPLAAVYISGSVVGMSAAGITSGLATLGMGGLLGLSSMATGIGVAVLLGVGAYAGVRKLTGVNEVTRSKRRELMLNEVIKQTQGTIALLVQDINFIVGRLNETLAATDRQEAQIRKLMNLMRQMSSAGDILTRKADTAQNSATRIRCAQHLNQNTLHALTREPTKLPLYDYISGFYEERTEVVEKDGTRSEVSRLTLKPDCDTKSLENLAKAFEAIGYFNVGDVLKGSAVDMTLKAKEKLAGLLS